MVASIRRPAHCVDQFPALRALGDALRAKEIPFVRQGAPADCGAACLAMLLRFLGKDVELSEIRSTFEVQRGSVIARAMVEAAARYGLRARGLKVEIAELDRLPRGAILHCTSGHFVVLDRCRGGRVHVVDPAFGRRGLDEDAARATLSGIALLFEATEAFVASTSMDDVVLGPIADGEDCRIDEVLDAAPALADRRPAPRLTGHIELSQVSFRYQKRSRFVVDGVSVTIHSGECVAIVGRSRSGKTTLARLIAGLYRPAPGEGEVLFDGVPLTQLDFRSLRDQVGMLGSRPHVFGTSIRANIAPHDATTNDEIRAAATRAGVHREVANMAMAYDTSVLAGGASLPVATRQRIALARALARLPAVLVLDEALGALDASSERTAYDELAGLACTRIVIPRHLGAIAGADRILVMEGGVLVESGMHDELLARRGAYAGLVDEEIQRGFAAPPRPPLIDVPSRRRVAFKNQLARRARLAGSAEAGAARGSREAPAP